jgi:hypothetical protein
LEQRKGEKSVNRRQIDKKYKRKFQRVYSELFRKFLQVEVKPSRVHMKKFVTDKGVEIAGRSRGYEFRMVFRGEKEE